MVTFLLLPTFLFEVVKITDVLGPVLFFPFSPRIENDGIVDAQFWRGSGRFFISLTAILDLVVGLHPF